MNIGARIINSRKRLMWGPENDGPGAGEMIQWSSISLLVLVTVLLYEETP